MARNKPSAPKVEGEEAEHTASVDHTEEYQPQRVEIVHDRTIINGHVLPEGTVVSISPFMVEAHRSAGVPLIDVADDDDREVYDVSEAFVSPDTEAK